MHYTAILQNAALFCRLPPQIIATVTNLVNNFIELEEGSVIRVISSMVRELGYILHFKSFGSVSGANSLFTQPHGIAISSTRRHSYL